MTRSVYSLSIRRKLAGLLFLAVTAFATDLSANSGSRPPASAAIDLPAIVFVQASTVLGVSGTERFPSGSRMVLLEPNGRDKKPTVLTAEFYAAADPQVDFAGRHVLFAAQKRPGEHWQIWEMDLHGNGSRQITKCESDCLRPAYLPADEIVYTSVETGSAPARSSLQVIGLDGSEGRPVTFGPGDWWLETVLRDGRILASANSPLADGSRSRLLYTLRPDGTGLESFRCEHEKQAKRGDATELEDGTVVFTEGSGALAVVKRGGLQEERIGAAGIVYRSPNFVEGPSIMVADKPASALHYELAIISANGRGRTRTIYRDALFDCVEPVAVRARPVPKKFWSNLTLSSSSGYFLSLDSSKSMDKVNTAATVRSVRVIAERGGVLGEVPVESDGSFYVQTPANQPVRFVLLDEQGRVIREEQSWVWTRPGEQRGCTGCHGDKARAPENRWPLALKRKGPPASLGSPTGETHMVNSDGH